MIQQGKAEMGKQLFFGKKWIHLLITQINMTSLVDKMKLPRDKDRRVRLTDEQRDEIRERHLSGETKK